MSPGSNQLVKVPILATFSKVFTSHHVLAKRLCILLPGRGCFTPCTKLLQNTMYMVMVQNKNKTYWMSSVIESTWGDTRTIKNVYRIRTCAKKLYPHNNFNLMISIVLVSQHVLYSRFFDSLLIWAW